MAGGWIKKARDKMTPGDAKDAAPSKPGKPAAGKLAALQAKAKSTGDKKLAQKVALAKKAS